MSNQNQSPEEFDLFAPNTEDNLHEVLAKGSYKWTNKYTAVFALALVVVTSGSAGIWYGHRSSASSTNSPFSGAAGFNRLNRGGLPGGAASSTALASGGATLGNSGSLPGGGGFGGGRGTPGTITSIKGKTVTITLDSDPTTPLKSGDSVSVRSSGGGQAFGGAPTSTSGTSPSRASSGKTAAPKSTSGATPAPSITGGPQGGGGRGGGFANNPELTACLAKNGVTLDPTKHLDRTDPKVAAAMQTCFASVGGGFGPRPSGAPTP